MRVAHHPPRRPTQLSAGCGSCCGPAFVPSHDDWFDPFAKEWGERIGVNVAVDRINTADLVPRNSAGGHDLG